MAQDGRPRAVALRDFVTRVTSVGWLDGANARTVLHVGAGGRSALAVDTARALAATLDEQSPSLRLEILDRAGDGAEWNGFARFAADPDDAVEVRGLRGVVVKVPCSWFEPF